MSISEGQTADTAPALQHIMILNIRINDMMMQLNAVMKTLMEENASLRKENSELKTKQEKVSKP